MKTIRSALLALFALAALGGPQAFAPAAAAPFADAMRGPVAIPDTTRPPRLGNAVNDDNRLARNYGAQPPVIPHRVDGYQVDKNFNKCLDCHARAKTELSQAIPVSASHYIDRAGKVLDRVSTRRYFCLQCHVAQEAVPALVGNGFRGDPADAAPAPRK